MKKLIFTVLSSAMLFTCLSGNAQDKVKVKKDGISNYKISLDVIRLAEPQRLSPSKAMYIVWMETEQNGRKNPAYGPYWRKYSSLS